MISKRDTEAKFWAIISNHRISMFWKHNRQYIFFGVVLINDVGMLVRINSSLPVNHVANMGRRGPYFLDEPFS